MTCEPFGVTIETPEPLTHEEQAILRAAAECLQGVASGHVPPVLCLRAGCYDHAILALRIADQVAAAYAVDVEHLLVRWSTVYRHDLTALTEKSATYPQPHD